MRSRRYRRTGILHDPEDENPMTGVANLFDIAMVFSVALLVALVMSHNIPELLNPTEDVTIVKNPGQEDMQIIEKKGQEIKVLNRTDDVGGGTGEALGTAYRLSDGRVIYVPENKSETS